LTAIEVEGGELERDVLFVNPFNRPPALVQQLGLRMFDENSVFIDEHRESSVPGIFVAGDLVMPIHNATIAAADAIAVAFRINSLLTRRSVA
jgi:thioredoxin reductase